MSTRNFKPGFWVHGAPARDLAQLESYLTGDDHDVSKVEWFDGDKFHNIFEYMDDAEFHRGIAENEGLDRR